MSHGYDHILELELEEKQRDIDAMVSEIVNSDMSLDEMNDVLWLWKNRKKIIRNKDKINLL